VCGLAHLILADHDGQFDRRDVIGLGFGVLGLLCSGLAVTMTIIVGLAVLIRRGWRLAAMHTLPIAAIYGVWFAIIGHEGYESQHTTIGELRSFVQTALANALSHMGQVWGVGALFAIVIVVGLVVAWLSSPHTEFRARAAAPIALLAGAFVFSLTSGFARSFLGSESAKASRYVHLLAAMTLPALAFAMDALARRWRVLYPAALVLLVVGIPGNIAALSPHGQDRFVVGQERLVEALAHSPYARRVPPALVIRNAAVEYGPIREQGGHLQVGPMGLTAGWLVEGADSGRIPKPSNTTPQLTAAATLTLVLEARARPTATHACQQLTSPITVTAQSGDVYAFVDSSIEVRVPLPNGALSAPRTFPRNSAVTVQGGPVTLVFAPGVRGPSPTLCRA